MVVHRPARIRYHTGDTLTFTSPEQPPPADRGPRLDWLNPEVPHSVENIDSHAYEAFRIEFNLCMVPTCAVLVGEEHQIAALERAY
jgi:hypothetical protein